MSTTPHHSDTAKRALDLLARGISQTQVAKALGVSDSVISELMSSEEFAKDYQEKSFQRTHKHNDHDDQLDDLESKLVKKLAQTAETIYDPMKLLAMAHKVNAMKRRGTAAPIQNNENAQVLQLVIPVAIQTRFTMNSRNQVIEAGDQTLITLQSGQLDTLVQNLPTRQSAVPSQLLSEMDDAHNHHNRSGQDSSRSSNQVRSSESTQLKYEREDEFGFRHENQSL